MRRTVICRPRIRFICMFNAPTFNDQHPHVQRSTFNLQPSTFNLQRSTFNAQRSTTNAPTFNLQPSTFNIQRPTFNAPTFPRFNVQPSHAQRPNLHPSPLVYRLSFIGYQLSAIGYDQPSTAINTHPPAHVGAPDPHSSETQDRAAAPGSGRSGYRAQARQGHIPGDQPVQ